MEAIQAQSMSAEGRRRAEIRLKMVHRALERIQSGSFGTCAECGQDIPLGRLEFMPKAPFCMDCARRR
jgi:DnaK suppressor protein